MTEKSSEENKNSGEDEKLLILPLNDKSSKKVSQVISNDTAREILGVLTDEPLSTSDIAEKLGIPLTTVQYNIEKLMDAGLVKVDRTKWSEKFREVKIYAPQKKLVVILPEKATREDAISALKKYLPMISFAALLSGFIELIFSGFSPFRVLTGRQQNWNDMSEIPPPEMTIPEETSITPPPMEEGISFIGDLESEATNITPSPTNVFHEIMDNVSSRVNDTHFSDMFTYGRIENAGSEAKNLTPPPITIPEPTSTPTPLPTAVDKAAEITPTPPPIPLPEPTSTPTSLPTAISKAEEITQTPMEIAEEAFEAFAQTDFLSHIGLWFFLGAVSIIVLLFITEWYRGRKGK